VKRQYNGKPIDATEQYVSESPYHNDGETLYATTKAGEVTTDFSRKDTTELQEKILSRAAKNPKSSLRKIADATDTHWVYVMEVLKDNNVERYSRSDISSLSSNGKRIVEFLANQPEMKYEEIADTVGVSTCYVSKIANANDDLVSALKTE